MQSVTAQVRYLNPDWRGRSEMPRIGDRESRHANTSKRAVDIFDARGMDLGLDSAGFMLTKHRSKVGDFHQDGEVRATYYVEIARLLQELTGAEHALILQHVVRTEDTSDFNKAYARFVHCDYSVRDARGNAERTLLAHGLELTPSQQWEFAWFNTWQPIEREVLKNPLAMIDARTLSFDDVVDYEYSGYGEPVRSSMPAFNPDHKLYFFPRMQTDEVLVMKQLDTRLDRARLCPHTSFDIDAPADAPGRRSIEVRIMCAFRKR